jgi:hypothetical protein
LNSSVRTLRHAAALALVGWYLMMPPLRADLDQTCTSQGIGFAASDLFWALVAWRNPKVINSIRCDPLRSQAATDAPLSRWKQIGEFETLAACRAAYEKQQAPVPNQEELNRSLAKLEFLDEGARQPSDSEVERSARIIDLDLRNSATSLKCIATDDPRLAK